MKSGNRVGLALVCGLACAVVAGCRAGAKAPATGRVYPQETPRGGVLDIQVIRESTNIVFTNTTARSFGPSTLWVNMRFSRMIEGLGVGQTMDLDLRDFKDEYGDSFRAGGFFASEAPQPVVLVQIEGAKPDGAAELLGMIVVKAESE
ncbi:hypothetical protein PHYC_01683 [Phycisphaerales bacterium]|nr:hypothetical protein PHYC_01683 [Phycisphaerales bacterium]